MLKVVGIFMGSLENIFFWRQKWYAMVHVHVHLDKYSNEKYIIEYFW